MCSQRTYVRYTRELPPGGARRQPPADIQLAKLAKFQNFTWPKAVKATARRRKRKPRPNAPPPKPPRRTRLAASPRPRSTSRSAPSSPVTDRVADLVEPFTAREAAESQLKAYRTELRRRVKRTERRGTSARRKATTEARKTRNRVEREARKHQRTVETTLKRNRTELEQRVRKAIDLLPV